MSIPLPTAVKPEACTRKNWLLLAGNLKDGEYLSFDREELSQEDAAAALKAQCPDQVFSVDHHGKWMTVICGSREGTVWTYGPPGWTSKNKRAV